MNTPLTIIEVATVIAKVLFDDLDTTIENTESDVCVIQGTYCRSYAEITVQLVGEMMVIDVSTIDDVRNRKGIEFTVIAADATEARIRIHMAFQMMEPTL